MRRMACENWPVRERSAPLAAATEALAMRSATASACAKSSLPFRNARSVNSPGRARRAPPAKTASSSICMTTGPPWPCNSTTSSPVKERGPGKNSAKPSSMAAPSRRKRPCTAARGGSGLEINLSPIGNASGPEMRTMPTPPWPGGVATAATVSGGAVRRQPPPPRRPSS